MQQQAVSSLMKREYMLFQQSLQCGNLGVMLRREGVCTCLLLLLGNKHHVSVRWASAAVAVDDGDVVVWMLAHLQQRHGPLS